MVDSIGAERDVRALERAYDDAWTSGDQARLLSFFTRDAVIITPYGDVWRGIHEIEEGLRDIMSQPARGMHTSTISAVHFVTADVAIADGQAVLDSEAAQATDDLPLIHSFSDVLVKRDSVWRIAHVRAYRFIS